jgi:hypothetical protein
MWLRLASNHKVAIPARCFSSCGYRTYWQRHGVHLISSLGGLLRMRNLLFVCYIRAGAKAPVALLPSGILCALFSRSSHCRRQMSSRSTRRERSKRREVELLMGDREYPIILPKCRLRSNVYGSFTCCKSTTWGRRLYFSSEGVLGIFSP